MKRLRNAERRRVGWIMRGGMGLFLSTGEKSIEKGDKRNGRQSRLLIIFASSPIAVLGHIISCMCVSVHLPILGKGLRVGLCVCVWLC